MAIKGKSRTKSKPKQVARAPRHEPVVMKPPLPMRRWVQVTAGVLLGALAVMFVMWVTNNLRQEKADKAAAAAAHTAAANKLAAGQAWQGAVTGAISRVGTVNPSLTPEIFKSMNAAIDQMVKDNTVPGPAVKIFQAGASSSKKSVKALSDFDLTGTIKDQGFDVAEAEYFTESRDRLIAALTTYQRAAEAALLAAKATPEERKALAAQADNLRSDANTQFQTAWAVYQSALGAAGIAPTPPAGLGG